MERVLVTLKSFHDMGATPIELAKEFLHLCVDESYLDEWYHVAIGKPKKRPYVRRY